MINREQIYKWWSIFHDEGEVMEVRSFGGAAYSGYYKNIDNVIRDIEMLESKPDQQIYFIINAIREDCYGRAQMEKMLYKPKNTTNDEEIIGRKWLMIDLDPRRVSGTNSSNEELEYAHKKAIEVYEFLKSNGFYDPVVCMSGNGYHLMYRCNIGVCKETDVLVARFLNSLAMIFSDEHVDVDKACKNRARLSKLYGTTAKKGADSHDRPCRASMILKAPDEIMPNDIEYIKKIADLFPEDTPTPSVDNNWGSEKFDVEEFLNRHNVKYTKEVYKDFGTKYVLEHCVFNENHKGKDACVFQAQNGALSYVCLHNSCSNYKWKDFRLFFEPNAYTKKEYNELKFKQKYYGGKIEPFQPIEESVSKGKKWMSMKDVKRVDITELLSISTGYHELDKKIIGLFAGELTVLSGLNASGKTSWLNCLSLNVIKQGFKVGVWSGEMQDWRFQGWLNQMSAGKNYVRKKEGFENFYYTPRNIADKISTWLDGKLFLYNNSYGSKWEQLFNDIKELVDREQVQMIILDNLAALCINGYDSGVYANQTKFILDIKDYAKQKNIHVILVAHPRKQNDFLRKESISGTADLTNIADNVFLIHRVGKDFEKRAGEFFGADKIVDYLCFSNVLEVAKNRQMGIVDHLVGMYYEIESRRLKNSIAEHIIYGWQEESVQMQVDNDFENDFTVFSNPFDVNEAPF